MMNGHRESIKQTKNIMISAITIQMVLRYYKNQFKHKVWEIKKRNQKPRIIVTEAFI